MFHNMQNCTIRNNLISDRDKNRQTTSDIPVQRFGSWVIDENLVPAQVIMDARMVNAGTNQRGNAILSRLQRMFAEDPKGKSKVSESTPNRMNRINVAGEVHFGPRKETVNTGQTDLTLANIPHTVYAGRQQEKLMANAMHAGHLDRSQFLPHQKSQDLPTHVRTIEVPSTTVEEFTAPKQNITMMNDLASENTQIKTGEATPGDIVQGRHGLLLGQQDSLALLQHNSSQIPQPTTMPPLQFSMDHNANNTPQVPSAAIPMPDNTESSPPMQKPSPKRPAQFPSPNSPPLAKRATPPAAATHDESQQQQSQQIPSTTSEAHSQPQSSNMPPLDTIPIPPGQTRVNAGASYELNAAARAAFLGGQEIGDGGRGYLDQRRTSSPATGDGSVAANPVGSTPGADYTAAGSRPHRRPTGWDIPDPSQDGNQLTSAHGITRYQYGAATWTRYAGTNQMDQGGPHRRGRRTNLDHLGYPYPHSHRRSPARSYSATPSPPEHDPWPVRPISPASSVGTQDSRYQKECGDDIQSHTPIEAYFQRQSNSVQQNQGARAMELDDGHLAPGPEAPQAP
jgi:hypothetical protein